MTEHARANNPGWTHRLYDDRAAQAFLADVAGSAVRRVFRLARLPAHRADILRLALLAAEGGVYLDVDDLCFGPLDRLLPAGAGLVVYQEPGGAIANNFLAAVPGHPVLAGALEEVCETFLHYSNESIWLSSGPGLVTRHVARHLAARAAAGSGDIVVHPIHAMRRAVSMHLPMDHKARANDWRAVSLATRAA
jgi:mannosyltransferase OCH1-like enzyme